jgi:hypothetical protein
LVEWLRRATILRRHADPIERSGDAGSADVEHGMVRTGVLPYRSRICAVADTEAADTFAAQ